MSQSDMQVFNQYIMPATIEMLGQMVNKFNADSGGSIILTTEGFTGDFYSQSFFASLHGTGRRVDRYGPNDPVAGTNLSELKETAVKVAGGIGPVVYEPAQLTWLRRPTRQGTAAAARNFAEIMMRDQLNSAIAALVAAISNNADVTNDQTGVGPVTYANMNTSHSLFGDMSGTLVASVMDGQTFHRLIGQNLQNVERLFVSTNVNVVDILGRRIVVTDAPALFDAGAPVNKVLSLAPQAAMVYDGGDVISNIDTQNFKERIETSMQVDYTFGLRLKGYTWDEVNGTRSPNDAAIATGTNWDRVSTDKKHTAGVITIGDA